MSLLEVVTTELALDREKAQAGLGALFTSIRLATDARTFETIKAKIPEIDGWVGRSYSGGGRTGEIMTLMGPQALTRTLTAAGFSADEIAGLGRVVGRSLKDILPAEAVTQLTGKLPLLGG